MQVRQKILLILLSMPILSLADGGPYAMMGCDTPVLDYVEPETSSIVIADALLSEGRAARLTLNADKNEIAVITELSDTVTLIKVDDESILRFMTMYPLAYSYPSASPYAYCMGDPINLVDPSGMTIEGMTKEDTKMIIQDIRAMFPGDEFANFRDLIKQSGNKNDGKSIARISPEAVSDALNGIKLNEYQQALVDILVNTINSNDIHKVEYITPGKEMSKGSLTVFKPMLNSLNVTPQLAENTRGGYAFYAMIIYGDAATTQTSTGTLSLILKTSASFPTNRPATLGHEVLGHGRSLTLGYDDAESQHVIPIQVENLILRNMGATSLFRDGSDHAPLRTIIKNYKSIPNI